MIEDSPTKVKIEVEVEQADFAQQAVAEFNNNWDSTDSEFLEPVADLDSVWEFKVQMGKWFKTNCRKIIHFNHYCQI